MKDTIKKICLLGSTGSIGCNTLNVVKSLRKHGYETEVKYLSTKSRIDTIAEQIKVFSPKSIVIQNNDAANEFRRKYGFDGLEILEGEEGLIEISQREDYNLLVNALVGVSGLCPTISALNSGKDVALANKETLVAAGKLVTNIAKEKNLNLIPIDSEHSAIFQCLVGEKIKNVDKLILTASGGPFLNKSIEQMEQITVKDALQHPNWNMGNKITIDSATMMNKGLEVIEAKWLFNIDLKKINVLIHPQSLIHSMVEFKDGSIKAQIGIPDMKIPIQYAITYPERVDSDYKRLDFEHYKEFTFEKPDFQKFRCLKIAFDAAEAGGTIPAVMNAANEIAVDLFLNGKINFLQIPDLIINQIKSHKNKQEFTIEDILKIDMKTRESVLDNYGI